jgi:hypothetical protein
MPTVDLDLEDLITVAVGRMSGDFTPLPEEVRELLFPVACAVSELIEVRRKQKFE